MSASVFPVPAEVAARAHGPGGLLGRARQAHRLDQALHQGEEHQLRSGQCLDQMVRGRHAERLGQLRRPPLATRGDQTAIIWEGDDPERASTSPTSELPARCLQDGQRPEEAMGVKKGDRVTLYLPMIPEAAYAMLACARIGAIHSIVFAAASPPTRSPSGSTAATPRW
jgi:acetyl-CoA synthetase